ncbi:hypothetical protein RHSIM_Rhsim02G0053100 [Rhododendron simsii]|uniref:S-protein homolog n=1 Tax=Rhododendron simsii TaxID=118357 RepID=A0A834H904_RHOSS|nr:hypothetical protein RHSIM_Rhsim02G0053100 [Rhododendron simsii]
MISFHKNYLLMLALILMAMHQSPLASSLVLADGPVFITNKIPGPLTIHCVSSAGSDLGIQTRQFDENFTWNVKLVAGKASDAYRCDLASGGLRGSFTLFDGRRDFAIDRCGLRNFLCLWQVRPDGIYFYHSIGDRHYFELQYSWPR